MTDDRRPPQASEDHDEVDVPEVIDAEEHGTIQLAFRDERVSDDDAFEMPDAQD